MLESVLILPRLKAHSALLIATPTPLEMAIPAPKTDF